METNSLNPEEIFNKAIEIADPTKRAAYLDKICKENEKLRKEVESLINAHEQAGDFLKTLPSGPKVTLDSSHVYEKPGSKIGRYELLQLIGEGGMGLVYLAQQKEPVRRKVVLKIVKPGMDSKQVIARFEAERQVLAILDHPNIARVFDAGTTETGRPYFVMEYVKGMSITRYCDEKKLSIEQRLRLFEQVCEGIHHAHQKGIIHRDIKPSNILVSVHDDKPVPKIIDFGIAKAITQPLTDKTCVTFQGQLLGTPEYMSPEQVDLATQDIDIRSDIYSLGVVLYELLTGVLPFEEESFRRCGFAEIQRTIREVEPASPSIKLTSLGEQAKTIATSRCTQVVPLARRLHRELEWIPLKAMRKDRCRRYRSVSEMADDVRNYLNGLPLIAGPETAIYRTKKFVQKHAGSVATVALVAAAIIIGLIVSTAMYFRAEDARRREAAARIQAEDAEKVAQEQRVLAEAAENTANEQRKLAEQGQAEAKAAKDEAERNLSTAKRMILFGNWDTYPNDIEWGGIVRNVSIKDALWAATEELNKDTNTPPLLRASAHGAMGMAFQSVGEYQDALDQMTRAADIRIKELGKKDPLSLVTMTNLGVIELRLGQLSEADRILTESVDMTRLALGKEHNITADALNCMAMLIKELTNRGIAAYQIGDYEEALSRLRRSDELRHSFLNKPSRIPELAYITMSLQKMGRSQEAQTALDLLRHRCRENDLVYEPYERLLYQTERLLGEAGSQVDNIWAAMDANELDTARESLDRMLSAGVLSLEHSAAKAIGRAYYLRGRHAHERSGALDKVLSDYGTAVRYDPNLSQAFHDLADLQATNEDQRYRNGALSVENATRACQIDNWSNSTYLSTLAAAYAEAADYEAAVIWQKKALNSVRKEDSLLQKELEARLDLYQSGKPFHTSETKPLVAWYKLDEVTSDSVLDSSANNHGKVSGKVSIVLGPVDNALQFNGIDEYIEIGNRPDFIFRRGITVACWIKVNKYDRSCQSVLAKGLDWGFERFWRTDSLDFYCRGVKTETISTNNVFGKTRLNDGHWHHVVGVYDGVYLQFYTDGRLDDKEIASEPMRVTNKPLYIGTNPELQRFWLRHWNGAIDDVRIYSYGFTAEEVENLYRETASNINQN